MSRNYVFIILLNLFFIQTAMAQQAEVLGGCFYNNTTNRIVIRIAVRNKTNNSTGLEFTGMRFGFQYNENAVNYVGYKSYMNSPASLGIDDNDFLPLIGPDTDPSPAVETESSTSRVANYGGAVAGTKVMQRRYINRSTSNCNNIIVLKPNQAAILMDIYFTLDANNPAYYKLNVPGYGFDSPEFIAQFITSHTGSLQDIYKEIAVVVIRNSNENNVYQPFDMQNCSNGKVNPITIDGNDISFITPVNNAILKGRFDQVNLSEQKSMYELSWEYLNNELVKNFEIERAGSNGEYRVVKTISSVMVSGKAKYAWSDFSNNESCSYRIKAVLNDGDVDLSQTLKTGKRSKGVSIYPNPVSHDLQVVLPNNFSSAQYTIYSSTGLLIKRYQKNGSVNKIGVGDLFPGLYLVEVTDLQTGERLVSPFQKL